MRSSQRPGVRRWCSLRATRAHLGRQVAEQTNGQVRLELVTRSPDVVGFVVQPKRWIVEWSIAWTAGESASEQRARTLT